LDLLKGDAESVSKFSLRQLAVKASASQSQADFDIDLIRGGVARLSLTQTLHKFKPISSKSQLLRLATGPSKPDSSNGGSWLLSQCGCAE
jgi:hypothetical protein